MDLALFAHPFSSYCQKVLIALYEHELHFTFRMLDGPGTDVDREFTERWPMRHMPLLVDAGRSVIETSVIIEYLERYRGATPALIPADSDEALQVRFLDRFFDNYVMTPMQRIVFDYLRPVEQRDARGVADARALLERSYAWLDGHMQRSAWAAGDEFTLADCAAAPSLFYADWVQPIPAECANVRAYRERLLARASVARAVDEARPYRSYFPPGAPDRD